MRRLDRIPDAVGVSSTCAIGSNNQRVIVLQHAANILSYSFSTLLKESHTENNQIQKAFTVSVQIV